MKHFLTSKRNIFFPFNSIQHQMKFCRFKNRMITCYRRLATTFNYFPSDRTENIIILQTRKVFDASMSDVRFTLLAPSLVLTNVN